MAGPSAGKSGEPIKQYARARHLKDDSVILSPVTKVSKPPRTSRPAKKMTKYESANAARQKEYFETKRQSLDRFCKETDFVATENVSSKLNTGDLSNSIHPLLNGDFPDTDARVLLKPLRLASRLLSCVSLKEFLGNMIVESATDCKSTTLALKGDPSDPIDSVLKYLGRIVSFQPGPKGSKGAVTHPDPSKTHPVFPNGCGSTIAYSADTYNRLCEATKTADDIPLLLWLRFEFAVTIVHELCHALVNALHGADDYAPFFDEMTTTEVGFELENHLFGGLISRLFDEEGNKREVIRRYKLPNGRKSQMLGVIVLMEWPNRGIVDSYKTKKLCMAIRDGKTPAEDIAWRVPLTFVQQFFTDHFWDVHMKKYGPGVLRPEKEIGYFFTPTMDDHSEPTWYHSRSLFRHPNMVPDGYRVNSKGELIQSNRK